MYHQSRYNVKTCTVNHLLSNQLKKDAHMIFEHLVHKVCQEFCLGVSPFFCGVSRNFHNASKLDAEKKSKLRSSEFRRFRISNFFSLFIPRPIRFDVIDIALPMSN